MGSFIFFFLTGTIGLSFIGYRLKKEPDMLTLRLNRNIIYIGLTFILALIFGILGDKLRNNAVFFLASVSTELSCYFCLSWVKISTSVSQKQQDKLSLVLKPRVLFFIALTCLFELFCFLMAGKEALTKFSISEAEEDVKNVWLWLASTSTLIFVCGASCISLSAFSKAIKQTTNRKFEYRYATLALFICFFLLYFALCTLGIVVYTFGFVNHEGYTFLIGLAGVLGAFPAMALMTILTIFDKKGYQFYQRIRQKFLYPYITELEEFFNKTFNLFPSNYRFNPYDFIDDQPLDWVLKSIINQLIDVRILIWRVDAWLQFEQKGVAFRDSARFDPVSISYEATVWHAFLSNAVDKSQIFTLLKRLAPPDAIPPLTSDQTEELAHYFILLDKEIAKLSSGELLKKTNNLESALDAKK